MRRAIIGVLIITLGLLLRACDTTEPPNDNQSVNLILEDVSCTEAWIKLSTTNLQLPTTILLKQNEQTRETINLITTDTLLYIDSLLPNTSYQYQASSIQYRVSSKELNITTLDTTSHNFSFETFTFGGTAGSSSLYDVVIVGDEIWAVGEIYVADTSINGYTTYNAVHWDGVEWELKRINMESSCNPVTYPPLRAIWAFSENNIVVTSGGSIGWFDGMTNRPDCSIRPLLTGSINKIWGTSINDLYVVGNEGNIAHYQNGQWIRIESGTDLPFQDIWGAEDKAGEEQILAIASDKFGTGGKYLVRINENNASHLNEFIPTAVSLSGIWFIPDKKYYLVGDGIYKKHILSDTRWQLDSITYQIQYYPYGVRGNGINNVVVCGEAGTISHFNGATWKIFNGLYIYDRLLKISMVSNIIIAVGTRYNNGINNQGIIYFGRR
jgi:hypothetical protein